MHSVDILSIPQPTHSKHKEQRRNWVEALRTREFLKRFRAYEWETPTHEIATSVGLPEDRVFRLDTNTSPFLPLLPLRELRKNLFRAGVNQYPDTTYRSLRELLSAYCQKGVDRFVVTNGADEGLDIITKTFLDPSTGTITATPTYSMFRIVTELMGARMTSVKRSPDFSVNVDRMLQRVSRKTRLIFLCNPNNPTGNSTPLRDVERLVRESDALVAVDEAYQEFAGKSIADLTDGYDNLVVIRTFSKAFSMAGVRVGYLVASESTVKELNKVRPPNSLTVISLALAESALKDTTEMRENVRRIVKERERCFKELSKIKSIVPYPSEANFILFRIVGIDANTVHVRLMKMGFVLRNLAEVPGIENTLRVTISTPQVNNAFIEALGSSLENQ